MTTDVAAVNKSDILEVISNLSNDEVFTPPKVANAVLDMLPPEVWANPELRWLDPGCKTGVFPREITKRLMIGLSDALPDEESRLEHILTNMVFAIAITEITSLMSRRTLYCSKDASSDFSTVKMQGSAGNVWFERIEHEFVQGRCRVCSGTKIQLEQSESENYAYGFIHEEGRKKIEQELGGMKFDIIIGNPPYQMDADAAGQNVSPLYNVFFDEAKKLSPKHIVMIMPSRWMVGGRHLDDFRAAMLNDKRIQKIVDYPNAGELFPGVEIKGGVCYLHWDSSGKGSCEVTSVRDGIKSPVKKRQLDEFDIFVRDGQALPILHKVLALGEATVSELVTTRDPFGPLLSSNFKGYRKTGEEKKNDLKLYLNVGGSRVTKFVDQDKVTRNFGLIDKWKVFVPKAGSDGGQKLPDVVLGNSILAEPKSVCTMTYLAIGPFDTKLEAESLQSYLRTRFFRFLVSLRKISQNSTQGTYLWVPQQSWDCIWTDEDLYAKYGITEAEQSYIETMIKEMSA